MNINYIFSSDKYIYIIYIRYLIEYNYHSASLLNNVVYINLYVAYTIIYYRLTTIDTDWVHNSQFTMKTLAI